MKTLRSLTRAAFPLMVLALALMATTPIVAQTGTISGTVTDADTGDPLPWVLMRASEGGWWGYIDFTNSDGFYEINDLVPGTYELDAFTFGYEPASVEVEVLDGETTTVDFALEPPAAGSVSGTATNANTGDPIADAHVFLLGSSGLGFFFWPFHYTSTDADGNYLFEDVDTGDYTLKVYRSGFVSSGPIAVTVVDAETAVVDVALTPLAVGGLEGTVTDASTGDPIEDALIVSYKVGSGFFGGGIRFTTTDAAGFYSFENVVTGSRRVKAFAIGYFRGSVIVDVLEGETTVADFALDPK